MIALTYLLVSLNVIDAVATYYGVSASLISEANPLMASFDALSILLIKISLSFLLFILVLRIPKLIDSKIIRNLLIVANVCYLGVFCLHVYWITNV
ncbi:MAG: hypothetical protein KKF57_01915 [Firmicutes bacterium]|nr:hypothetical protein [Bacillota bacterium]